MGARTGSQFLEGIRKTKYEIWVDRERIEDVTTHPKLRGGVESVAAIFDRRHAHAAGYLFVHLETGEPTNVSHRIPRSRDELWWRHAGLPRLSEGSMGMMGRTPDYMSMKFSVFASAPRIWPGACGCNERGDRNIVNFQRRLNRAGISLTRAITQPTVDVPA